MGTTNPLDRPVWNALQTGWASLAQGGPAALRLRPDYGPFAAAAELTDASQAALAAMVSDGSELWLVETAPVPTPPGTTVARRATLHQMIAASLTPAPPPPFEIMPLDEADATAMLALATLTKPGPFLRHTNRLGGFVGVKRNGALVAMAGERMKLTGYAEVSGVCTHPEHRGNGYAGALMRVVAGRMLERGETPILHSYAGNVSANALYATLGFTLRREVTLTVLTL